ncbi:MAG: LysR family transcriptional regulator [Deltaproteobacteria bacterium]|nr:LysR family transcriptional regulator [Deltaproteobacteria bacterium]
MKADLSELQAFVVVAEARGFREAARLSGGSASGLSDAVGRLEEELKVRLLHRTTRSVTPTEAGQRLLERLRPALGEVDAAVAGLSRFAEAPAGMLRLNVPVSAARFVLPSIIPAFLAKYPEIQLEVIAESNLVDVIAAGCDAGIRYEERLEKDMIAVPIGPRVQCFATAASPSYVEAHGRPKHPRELTAHACLTGGFSSGPTRPWEFERDGKVVRVDPTGPLILRGSAGVDLGVAAAVAGVGIIHVFEDWLRPHFAKGTLVPILKPWWQRFSGPFLYYSGRHLVPAPLRAFIDFIKASR